MLSVAYSTRIIKAMMLRVDHGVSIFEETAVGMVGGIFLIQYSQVIEDVVRVESKSLAWGF
jgi:hypothetical protein